VAVASGGPYASLHLDPDTQPCQDPTPQFFTGRMLFLPPNHQRQSTEGRITATVITTKHGLGAIMGEQLAQQRADIKKM